MPKKIAPRKKITPRTLKLNKALQAAAQPESAGEIVSDQNPKDHKRLINAMINFIGSVCVEVLDFKREQLRTDEHGPLNLNDVHDKLIALKADRDAWRTRCESIEAAFNALGSQSSGEGKYG